MMTVPVTTTVKEWQSLAGSCEKWIADVRGTDPPQTLIEWCAAVDFADGTQELLAVGRAIGEIQPDEKVSREWVNLKHGELFAHSHTIPEIDGMTLREFADAILGMHRGDGGDRPETPEPKAESAGKNPTSERVLRAINYVNGYYRKVERGNARDIPLNAILSIHMDKPTDSKDVKNLARQLRDYRHMIRKPADK